MVPVHFIMHIRGIGESGLASFNPPVSPYIWTLKEPHHTPKDDQLRIQTAPELCFPGQREQRVVYPDRHPGNTSAGEDAATYFATVPESPFDVQILLQILADVLDHLDVPTDAEFLRQLCKPEVSTPGVPKPKTTDAVPPPAEPTYHGANRVWKAVENEFKKVAMEVKTEVTKVVKEAEAAVFSHMHHAAVEHTMYKPELLPMLGVFSSGRREGGTTGPLLIPAGRTHPGRCLHLHGPWHRLLHRPLSAGRRHRGRERAVGVPLPC